MIVGPLIELAGPSGILSFIIGGIITIVAAKCFAELATRIPTNGSQYSYVYIYYGECLGFM